MAGEHFDDDRTCPLFDLSQIPKASHYVLVRKIGSGGMGEVYLAEDTSLDRKVVLKFLQSHLCQDANCRARFVREARAAAQLNHHNIATIHEESEFNGRPSSLWRMSKVSNSADQSDKTISSTGQSKTRLKKK